MAKPELQGGEVVVNQWILNFRPAADARFTGTFYVTDRRVIFDAEHNNSSLLAALVDRRSFGSHGTLSVDFEHIKEVVSEKSLLKKTVVLHVADGDPLRFDYGMLSVDKIVKTLKTQLNAAVGSNQGA